MMEKQVDVGLIRIVPQDLYTRELRNYFTVVLGVRNYTEIIALLVVWQVVEIQLTAQGKLRIGGPVQHQLNFSCIPHVQRRIKLEQQTLILKIEITGAIGAQMVLLKRQPVPRDTTRQQVGKQRELPASQVEACAVSQPVDFLDSLVVEQS